MRAEFDIGDVITLQVTGKILKYSVDDTGDCYTVSINDGKGREEWLYFSGAGLKMCGAMLTAPEMYNE